MRQEQDTSLDGRVDTWIALDPESGAEREVRRDTNADGQFDFTTQSAQDTVPWALLESLQPLLLYPADPSTGRAFGRCGLRRPS